MFKNNGHVHGFITPGEGQTIPSGQIVFKTINLLSITHLLLVFFFELLGYNFLIQTHRRLNLILP